jgi:hypothetical protein
VEDTPDCGFASELEVKAMVPLHGRDTSTLRLELHYTAPYFTPLRNESGLPRLDDMLSARHTSQDVGTFLIGDGAQAQVRDHHLNTCDRLSGSFIENAPVDREVIIHSVGFHSSRRHRERQPGEREQQKNGPPSTQRDHDLLSRSCANEESPTPQIWRISGSGFKVACKAKQVQLWTT